MGRKIVMILTFDLHEVNEIINKFTSIGKVVYKHVDGVDKFVGMEAKG